MARRSGKAATRKARQKRAQRQPGPSPTPASSPTPSAAEEPTAVGSGDAFDQADAALRASVPPPGTRAGQGPQRTVRARTSDFVLTAGSSRLTDRAAAEYHYVVRDLRNIAVLLVVMTVLLAVAAIAASVLGIGQG